jgi:hypothetical protein
MINVSSTQTSKKSDVTETIALWARAVANGREDTVEHPQTPGGWACWHVGGPVEPTEEQKAEVLEAQRKSKQHLVLAVRG